MTCIKTGAHAYLEEYNEWVYGDMHRCGQSFVFRVAQTEFTPIYTHKHFTIHSIDQWWKDKPYGTIIACSATNHGYEGVPIDAT